MRLAVFLVLCLRPATALAASGEAEKRVEEGLAHYESGDYAAAAQAFAQAETALPDDPRILFDLGATLAAKGDIEQADALLQKAATSADHEIALRAHYNLGCLAAEKARALFGNRPEEASPEVRQQGMDLLDQAAGRYRDCLRLDENHADARYNLEVIRLWTARMRNAWSVRDREKPVGPTTPDKPSPKEAPSQAASKQSSDKEGAKCDKPGKPGEVKTQPPGGENQGAPGNGQEVPWVSAGSDASQEQAEKLFSKVRQRSQEKRQWDKQHQPNRPEGPEEKDW